MRRVTFILPAIGHRPRARRYLRLWQMEPLQPATLAALTPRDLETRFYDDRLEPIPYDEPTDLVAISVETYSARRAYQIASEFRKRGRPVVMGGFHASLCPDEVARYAEAVVIGEAEDCWPRLIDDFRHGRLEKTYRSQGRARFGGVLPDRSLFRGKKYMNLGLVETGRGCNLHCDFCAVQSMFQSTHKARDPDAVAREIRAQRDAGRRVFFLVDDHLTADPRRARELFDAIAPLGVRWLSQTTVTAGRDPELMDSMARSGCVGVLLGFESLNRDNLRAMNKQSSLSGPEYPSLIPEFHSRGIAIYGTFVFGYDHDTEDSFHASVEFAREHRLYIAAFNSLIPFPGTPLYQRLETEGRLSYPAWWLADGFRFNEVPFNPRSMSASELSRRCLDARKAFYSMSNIFSRCRRGKGPADGFLRSYYWLLNILHRFEVVNRNGYPLGDESWRGELLEAQ